jgi:hypothetical protein
MGAHYRRKYTVLRHWLIHKSKIGFVRLQIAEEIPNIDLVSPDLVVFQREDQADAYGHNPYRGESFSQERGLPVTVT